MKPHIEFFQTGEFRVYVENVQLRNEIKKLEGVRPLGKYWHPNGIKGWDFIFPSKHHSKVTKLLKIAEKEALKVGELQNA